jgi:hypothetical protein
MTTHDRPAQPTTGTGPAPAQPMPQQSGGFQEPSGFHDDPQYRDDRQYQDDAQFGDNRQFGDESRERLQPQQVPTGDTVASEPSTEQSLFATDKLSGLRSRWDHVQAGFVDNPRECVQQADGLVSDVVDELTSAFSHARSGLESQWARGEQASTEDLRLALKRYREFFDRLLSV